MSATPNNCFHPTVENVREIHAEAIGRFGGSDGVRERALLESAVAAPQARFGGQFALPGHCGSGGGVFVLPLQESSVH